MVLVPTPYICSYSAYEYVVPARGKELVKTDLQIELPHGCYGRVAPRSGLAVKNFIDVGGRYIIIMLINVYRCYITVMPPHPRTHLYRKKL